MTHSSLTSSGGNQTLISVAACDPGTICASLEEKHVVLDS